MQLKITHEDALNKHPILVDEVIAKLRKSKSKHKNCCGDQMEWFYNYSIKLDTFAKEKQKVFVSVLGTIGNWKGYSSIMKSTPEEVESKLNS